MKRWFLETFLPMWAKETVLADNRRLQKENEVLKQETEKLAQYTRGVIVGQRAVKKSVVTSTDTSK